MGTIAPFFRSTPCSACRICLKNPSGGSIPSDARAKMGDEERLATQGEHLVLQRLQRERAVHAAEVEQVHRGDQRPRAAGSLEPALEAAATSRPCG